MIEAWWKRLATLVRPGVRRGELDEELAFHLEMETRKNLAAGMAPAEARRRARTAFGQVERFREEAHDWRTFRWLEDAWLDLRLALRGLRRSPGFAALAIGTLALGIGAATTIFGVVDAVVLRPLPFASPERLVEVRETTPAGSDFSAAAPNYLDFRDHNSTLDGLAAYRRGEVALTGEGRPERLHALWATHDLPRVLGIAPAVGRAFAASEDAPGGESRVALVSHRLWHERFGGDASVLGRSLTLDGEPFTVVGVLPPELRLLAADVWLPLAPDPHGDRGDHWLDLVGRLGPGVTRAEATADLAAIAARSGTAHPGIAGWSVRLLGLDEAMVGERFGAAGVLLLAAVLLLLLMGVVNVAGLLLARATARQGEIGVRVALGAARWRLLRQLLTESMVLAVLGALLGIGGTAWALRGLRGVPPELVPRLGEAALDGRLTAFAVAIALGTTLVIGALPALVASRVDLQATLKQSGRGGVERRRHRLRETLVVAQVALAVVLLLGAGLMMRSLLRLHRVDPGFTTASVWTVPLQLPTVGYAEPWQKVVFTNRVLERLAAMPGVAATGAINITPFSDSNLVNDVTPEDRAAETPPSGFLQAAWRIVTPGYFAAAGVPRLGGRTFTDEDRYGEPRVAVVSRSLAARLWPGEEAVGRRLFWGGTTGTPLTVVGVVGDIRDFELEADPLPMMFLPMRQIAWPAMTLVVRGDGEIQGMAEAVRRAVWEIDPALPVPEVRLLAERRSAHLVERRTSAALLAGFAAAALLLAAVGLYGVLAFAVVQRRQEIAVRMAFGARATEVTALLVRRGLLLTGAGVALGLVAAAGVARVLEGLLYETAPTDPVTYAAVAALFAAVALLATSLPARRAARTDPMVALRQE